MALRDVTTWIDEQGWFEKTADAVLPAVMTFFDALGPARRSREIAERGRGLSSPWR